MRLSSVSMLVVFLILIITLMYLSITDTTDYNRKIGNLYSTTGPDGLVTFEEYKQSRPYQP